MSDAYHNLERQVRALHDDMRRWHEESLARHAAQEEALAECRKLLVEQATIERLLRRKTLSVPEAALLAGVEPATVRKWLSSGALGGTKVGKKQQSQWRVSRRTLDRFMDRHANQADQEPEPGPDSAHTSTV